MIMISKQLATSLHFANRATEPHYYSMTAYVEKHLNRLTPYRMLTLDRNRNQLTIQLLFSYINNRTKHSTVIDKREKKRKTNRNNYLLSVDACDNECMDVLSFSGSFPHFHPNNYMV